MTPPIEPKILPLVNALNETKIVETFSSCEGHYDDDIHNLDLEVDEKEIMDRGRAEVRFDPAPNISLDIIERMLIYIISEFDKEHGFYPAIVYSKKIYVPNSQLNIEFVFSLEIRPFNRLEDSIKKRLDTDRAIIQTTEIVNRFKRVYL